ncbi:tubulin-like doman-containing protein [Spongiactinospora sp. TRM90649]|uniref:tubulin-like doman-containing protein n=1 Tax=Spongiactinospora sp. TRM90649 TaxID=3031114 RepID=UPI0023F9BED4|nr:tubulin-like doman-containing protein [Spongiactinospora sp. TRM90649]MDF5752649.1 tubulin-like doman-containing protein [Spongiactinospora sp. TRM90649]
MRSSLVVGLGGTGSQAVVHLKRRLYTHEQWRRLDGGGGPLAPATDVVLRAVDVDNSRPHAGLVSLDGNNEDIALAAEVAPVIRRLKDWRPGEQPPPSPIAAWFKPDDARHIKESQTTAFMTNGAGQIRAFGRIAFFQDMIGDKRARQGLSSAFDAISQSHGELDIYVVTSVAGGTGAGLVIDTLAWLQKEGRDRDLNFRTTLFCVMPAAFKGTLSDLTFQAGEANGFATLRELDRLIKAEQPVKFTWSVNDSHVMEEAPVSQIYLLDGTRQTSSARRLRGYRADQVCPVAIADAIYAQLLPGPQAGRISRQVNEVAYTKAENDLYSTFGIYVVEYAWQPLVSGLTVQAAARFTADLLGPAPATIGETVDRFLSGTLDGATGVPRLVGRELGGGVQRRAAPRWLEPAEGAVPFPPVPVLAEPYQDVKAFRTKHVNADVDADVTSRTARFLGTATGTQRQFYPAAERNVELARVQWRESLYAAVGLLLSGGPGGANAAVAFLTGVGGRIRQYEEDLQRSPAPEPGAKRGLAEQERQTLLAAHKSGRKQLRYLAAQQDALDALVERDCWERATRLLGYLGRTVAAAVAELTRLRDVLEETGRVFEADSQAIAGDRGELDAAPLRRVVPPSTPEITDRFYAECVGPQAQGETLPVRLAERRRALTWSLRPGTGDQVRLHVGEGGGPEREAGPAEVARAIRGCIGRLFDPLRHKSVFEILETSGESPDKLAEEFEEGGGLLANYDRARHFDIQRESQSAPQLSAYVYADVPAEGRGHELGTQFEGRLSRHGIRVLPIAKPGEETEYPTTDKILYFAVQHRLVLPAFTSVERLRPSYDSRRGGTISPHVLIEEKGAARIEDRAKELAEEGVLAEPMGDLKETALSLCADVELLRCTAIAYAHSRLEFRRNADNVGGRWYALFPGRTDVPFGRSRDLAQSLEPLSLARTPRDAATAAELKRLAAELAEQYDDPAATTRDFFAAGPPGEPTPGIAPWLWTVLTVASHIDPG